MVVGILLIVFYLLFRDRWGVATIFVHDDLRRGGAVVRNSNDHFKSRKSSLISMIIHDITIIFEV